MPLPRALFWFCWGKRWSILLLVCLLYASVPLARAWPYLYNHFYPAFVYPPLVAFAAVWPYIEALAFVLLAVYCRARLLSLATLSYLLLLAVRFYKQAKISPAAQLLTGIPPEHSTHNNTNRSLVLILNTIRYFQDISFATEKFTCHISSRPATLSYTWDYRLTRDSRELSPHTIFLQFESPSWWRPDRARLCQNRFNYWFTPEDNANADYLATYPPAHLLSLRSLAPPQQGNKLHKTLIAISHCVPFRQSLVWRYFNSSTADFCGACFPAQPASEAQTCPGRSQIHSAEHLQSLSRYKFHLAVENSQHPNYVTEKFYNSLFTDSIPIIASTHMYLNIKHYFPNLRLIALSHFPDSDSLHRFLATIDATNFPQFLPRTFLPEAPANLHRILQERICEDVFYNRTSTLTDYCP